MKNVQIKKLYITFLVVMAVAGLSFNGSTNAAEFTYNGDTGPAYWWELDAEWGACAGTALDARQSPVNIKHAKVDKRLKRLDLQTYPTTINIFNNGHAIEQHYEDTGSSIYFEGREYELQQFHFHTLSEHAVKGERGSMELHAVFLEPESGDNLVVGMLFDISKKNNAFLQTLIDAGLPEKNGDETVTNDLIDLADVLTNTSSYYTYAGSLTTPPCSENVTWVVLKEQAKFTMAQFQSFRRILGNDFRPLQDLNGREVRMTRGKRSHRHHDDDHDDD